MAEPLTIRCRENGPLVVQLPVRVVDHRGNEYPLPTGKDAIALCRCGQSARKPWCDGAHRQHAFQGGDPAPAAAPDDRR